MTRTLLAAAIALTLAIPARAQYLPPDPQPTCTVTPSAFSAWWTSGAPVLDGDVSAADSLAFPNGPNCDFYRWSEQMFLWLTSPTSTGDVRLVASSSFFDVTPKDGSGARTLVPHAPGVLRITSVRTPPASPNGLPLVMDRSGRAFEVERATRTPGRGELRVRDLQGRWVAVEHARWSPRGELVLTDRAGREIHPARPDQPGRVQRVVVDATPIFLTSSGAVADVEQGQAADLNVLMSQAGSLVYYAINVNDVFAYYLTGYANGAIGFGQFPTTPGQISAVLSYATANGASIADGNALALEVKTSWVEAATLAHPTQYIRMTAQVPDYTPTSATTWTATGTTKTMELAMVGLHVAGSVRGHPEMIWATFEHENNAPNDRYTYVNTSGVTTFVPRNATGSWLFSASGATSFNASHQALDSLTGDIVASGAAISPSDTIRSKAWGTGFDAPNAPFLNTEVISINDSVLSKMPPGDVRRSYRFIGAVWLGLTGAAGTTSLANATLETTQQGDSTKGTGLGCLDCHTGTAASSVSQIYGDITPLF